MSSKCTLWWQKISFFGFRKGANQLQLIGLTGLSGKKLAGKKYQWKKSCQNAHVHSAFQSKRSAWLRALAKLEWLSIWKLATSTAKVLSWLLYLLCKVYLCKKMWFKSVLPGRKKLLIPRKKRLKVRRLSIYLDLKDLSRIRHVHFGLQSHNLDLT